MARRRLSVDWMTWTPAQRRVLLGLVAGLLGWIVWLAAVDRAHLDDPPQAHPARAALLADRIDPNSADLAMLATLPGIGPVRAQGIIAYRQRVADRGGTEPAFAKPEDLLFVDGFGFATVEQLRPHLIFPSPQPEGDAP